MGLSNYIKMELQSKLKSKENDSMMIQDIIDKLANGELMTEVEMQMVSQLIKQLCELIDDIAERELGHINSIRTMKKQIEQLEGLVRTQKRKTAYIKRG